MCVRGGHCCSAPCTSAGWLCCDLLSGQTCGGCARWSSSQLSQRGRRHGTISANGCTSGGRSGELCVVSALDCCSLRLLRSLPMLLCLCPSEARSMQASSARTHWRVCASPHTPRRLHASKGLDPGALEDFLACKGAKILIATSICGQSGHGQWGSGAVGQQGGALLPRRAAGGEGGQAKLRRRWAG